MAADVCAWPAVAEGLGKAFASPSSAADWDVRGDEYFRQQKFHLAKKCYTKSGNTARQHEVQARLLLEQAATTNANK
jgi:hypothetical protein